MGYLCARPFSKYYKMRYLRICSDTRRRQSVAEPALLGQIVELHLHCPAKGVNC